MKIFFSFKKFDNQKKQRDGENTLENDAEWKKAFPYRTDL